MATIHAAEKLIKDIFHRDYAFSIPAYQRPYSWGVDQASALFSDLAVASEGFSPNPTRRKIETTPYFLGSIVLIKKDGDPHADVIDGQQRLTTLSLLLSALRVSFDDPEQQQSFASVLLEKGDRLVGTHDRCRLTLRERDHAFLKQIFSATKTCSIWRI